MTQYLRSVVFFLIVAVPVGVNALSIKMEPLKPVRVDESLGVQLPKSMEFIDHNGQKVSAKDLFANGKPTVLTFVYYRCPAACTLLLNGLTAALEETAFQLGRDFNMVTISVDGREGTDLAKAKRDTYVKTLQGTQHDTNSWTFLTASREDITTITDLIGYRFVYDPDTTQYEHPSVLMFVSPSGELKRYLYGSYFHPDNVRLAFIEAGDGRLGSFSERLSQYFYDFGTPEAGRRYVFNQNRLITVAFAGTILLGLLLWLILGIRSRRSA